MKWFPHVSMTYYTHTQWNSTTITAVTSWCLYLAQKQAVRFPMYSMVLWLTARNIPRNQHSCDPHASMPYTFFIMCKQKLRHCVNMVLCLSLTLRGQTSFFQKVMYRCVFVYTTYSPLTPIHWTAVMYRTGFNTCTWPSIFNYSQYHIGYLILKGTT